MTPADDLPPLPRPMSEYSGWAFDEHQMRAYALAARAERDAEIEQLKRIEQVCYDIHAALGVKWGDNPYLAIDRLKQIPGGDNTIYRRLRDADALGVVPPQDWTTRAADEMLNLHRRADAAEAKVKELEKQVGKLKEVDMENDALRADRDQCVKNMNDNAEHADALRAQIDAIRNACECPHPYKPEEMAIECFEAGRCGCVYGQAPDLSE